MARPLKLYRRGGGPDSPDTSLVDTLSLGDVFQRLALLNADKMHALEVMARDALADELAERQVTH